MHKIAVLIPCYNEEQTIKNVVESFQRELPEAVIYVYNNNSTDQTAEIAKEAGAIVRHEYQQGKGNVVRRMFQEIDAECYIMVDGDDTYPAESVREMADKILYKNVDMVVGDRLSSTYFEENKRRFHNFGNSLVRLCVNRIFKSDIKDIMTGYRAFSYRFVKTFPVLSKGFEIETEMSIHAISMNMAMDNVVVEYRDRPQGSVSKLNTVKDGIKVLMTIFNLFKNYKPMFFFSFISIILCAVATLCFVPLVWLPYLHTGMVERFPTLIVCGFVVIAALLSFFNGMVLDSIKQKEKREFEFRLIVSAAIEKELLTHGDIADIMGDIPINNKANVLDNTTARVGGGGYINEALSLFKTDQKILGNFNLCDFIHSSVFICQWNIC